MLRGEGLAKATSHGATCLSSIPGEANIPPILLTELQSSDGLDLEFDSLEEWITNTSIPMSSGGVRFSGGTI